MADILTPPEPADRHPRRTSVYRYYDRHGLLLYVGITSRGSRRNGEHNRDKEWWPFVVRQEVEHLDSRPAAAAREKELIRLYRPPFNTLHNAGWEDLRTAYLAYAASVEAAPPAEPRRPQKKAVPLDMLHMSQKVSTWRSRPEDADIVSRLVQAPTNPPFTRNGQQHGHVVGVDVRGPVAIVQLSHSHAHPRGVLYAHLRCVLKHPASLEIKKATWQGLPSALEQVVDALIIEDGVA